MNANHQGVAPVQNEMGSAPQPQRGMARSALAAGAKGEFGARVGEGLGVALGRMATDTGYAIKDAADGTGTLGRNMKDALVSAGSEGASAFRTGAESRITNFKAVTALRDSLQGPPGPSKA